MLQTHTTSQILTTCTAVLACFVALLFTNAAAAASTEATVSSPQLNIILPRGIQRDGQRVLTFTGVRLQEAQEVLFYSQGVSVTKLEQVDAKTVKATVQVAADCRLGEHVAQLRTASGLTEYRSFFVGAMSEVAEVEPNNEFEKPQAIDHNITITGIILSEDVDHYSIKVTKGQRVSIEVEAIRLGTTLIDPFISVLDQNRFELHAVDDTMLCKQDCFLSFIAKEDTTYTVLVRDSSYGGNGACHYRMHVGNFPRPSLAFPAGGPANAEAAVTLLGDPSGPIEHKFTPLVDRGFRKGIFFQDDKGITPSPIAFRVSDLPNVLEAEPNSTFDNATPISFPGAANGLIQTENDHDWFAFEGKKGQVIDFEVFAKRVNSKLDSIINIYGPDKKHIQGNDDSRGSDPYVRITLPVDGKFYVRVRDLLNRGQDDFVYRLELSQPKAKLTVSIPPVARYSQYRQSIFIPQGGKSATLLNAVRGDFAGEIKLIQDGLPQGVTMHTVPMAANMTQMPVVFEAAADAPLAGKLVELVASHVDDAKKIQGGYRNVGQLVSGPPNNRMYVGCEVDRLPVAVIKKLPFSLEIVQPKAPLVRDGSIQIKVKVHRDEGFEQPITLQFPFRSPGVGTRGTVKVPADKNEIVYPLNANGNAALADWPMYILGSSNVGGNAWCSSQLATLKVAERFVTLEMQRASCEQGQETQFVCKLNHLTAFEGKAKAILFGLPPNATAEPLEFDKTTTELVFAVKTKADTPPGKHKGVFCQVQIPFEGELIVATAGRSELQVDKPLPKQPAKPAPAPEKVAVAAPAKPAAKPLSRLEKLREAARKQGGKQ